VRNKNFAPDQKQVCGRNKKFGGTEREDRQGK